MYPLPKRSRRFFLSRLNQYSRSTPGSRRASRASVEASTSSEASLLRWRKLAPSRPTSKHQHRTRALRLLALVAQHNAEGLARFELELDGALSGHREFVVGIQLVMRAGGRAGADAGAARSRRRGTAEVGSFFSSSFSLNNSSRGSRVRWSTRKSLPALGRERLALGRGEAAEGRRELCDFGGMAAPFSASIGRGRRTPV